MIRRRLHRRSSCLNSATVRFRCQRHRSRRSRRRRGQKIYFRAKFGNQVSVRIFDLHLDLECSLLPVRFGSYFRDVAVINMVGVGFRCHAAGLVEPYFGSLGVSAAPRRGARPLVASKALGRHKLVFVSQLLKDDPVDWRANNCPSQLPAS